MKIRLAGWVVGGSLVGLAAASAVAGQSLVRFDGGIGVIPVSAGPAADVVRGVSPGGQPWVIRGLRATVEVDGHVKLAGRGLLPAEGNGSGRPGTSRSGRSCSVETSPTGRPWSRSMPTETSRSTAP